MPEEYDAKQCDRLRSIIEGAELHHPPRPTRYDPGQQLEFDVTGVHPAVAGRATLVVERFVGGGFAGQVYRARLTALDGGPIPGLEPGAVYAVKILVPPSRFSQFFRDAIYRVGYQCPFAAQVNAGAARTGVLWQKLIRRGAQIRFGSERCVADTYATFLDPELGAFGEINEWVDGRNWRFEIDDEVTGRRKRSAAESASSREYLAKKEFMAALVRLFHDMGAPELARQYEWWTAKSQPNVLKRLDADATPEEGLTALDFRAGLALLPFLPMSPADFKLIVKGMARGDLVQFDRGDLGRLRAFCAEHEAAFADLMPALEELEQADPAYRRAQPDLLHHGLRLMYDGGLRRAVKAGFIEAWRVKGRADEAHAARLGASSLRFWLFFVLGVVPFLGTGLRKLWGASSFARHVAALFTSLGYLARALRASRAQCLLAWYRTGKVGEGGVEFFLRHPVLHFVTRIVPGLLPLPPKWHRFLTDPKFAARSIAGAVVYPVRFYRDAAFRVEWLTGEIEAGAREGMLTPDERQHIL
ncbi:MAG: hypothetical protein JXR94_17805, partial [Candidatus Hydrogenedentes bacterium]|nr:hypothetical protein [Candidatus Hydrogenedentota bacterium]